MTSSNYRVRRRSLVSKKASEEGSRLLPAKGKGLSRRYNSERRKIALGSASRFTDAVLLWRTSRGVRTFRLPASRQRGLVGALCLSLFFVASFASMLLWQRGEIAIEKRRLEDSAALLREAHSAWLEGGSSDSLSGESGLSGRSRSQALLAVLEPQLGREEQREKDLRLLRDRADLKKSLRRLERSLQRERSRSSDLSLDRVALRKKNERLRRDLRAVGRDLSFQKKAMHEAEKHRVGAEDRLASAESDALSLLKDLRELLGEGKGRMLSSDEPMLAIRDLAEDVAKQARGRRERLASYSESLGYAIAGLERTVFDLGISPDFLAGLGYDLSPVIAHNDDAEGGTRDGDAALVSAGLGGPLDEEGGENIEQEARRQTFADLDERFERFDALRKLVGCMPLSHPLHGDGRFVSGYGRRTDPFTREPAMHYGIDLGAWYDTLVYAGGNGRVSFTGYKTDYGRVVEVDHGCGFLTRYAHLGNIRVKVGDEVDTGSVLGAVGNTGRSTGPHLHYEVRLQNNPFDPKPFIEGVRNVF